MSMATHEATVYNIPPENTPGNPTAMNNLREQNVTQVESGDIQSLLKRKMFVGGLSNDIKEDHMKRYFGQFGQVVKAEVIKSGEGKSRGFGFVTFTDEQVVLKLLGKEHVIESRKLDCRSALLPGTKGEGVTFHPAKLFVGGISSDTTSEMLRDYFTQFGTVYRAEIMYDHITDKSRGFGFVLFEHQRYIQNVLGRSNYHLINGRYCEVKQAVPRQVAQRLTQPIWVPAPVVPTNNMNNNRRYQNGVHNQPLVYVPYVPMPSTDMMYPYVMYPTQQQHFMHVPSAVQTRAVSQPLPIMSSRRNTSQNSLP